jgi:hypothetical protein
MSVKRGILREKTDIKDLEEGKEVSLTFDNGTEYVGIFKGIDGDEILLKSTISSHIIGLPLNRLESYIERTS